MKEHYFYDGLNVYVKIGDLENKVVCTVNADMPEMSEIICEWLNYSEEIG